MAFLSGRMDVQKDRQERAEEERQRDRKRIEKLEDDLTALRRCVQSLENRITENEDRLDDYGLRKPEREWDECAE